MPEAFIAAIAYIGSAIGGAAGATLILSAVEIGTALYFAAAIAVSVGYSNAQKRRAQRSARDAYNASLEDRLVMTSQAGGQRSRVYGRTRNVEGVIFKATSGANSELYTLVVSVAGHEVDAIETVYFDDVAVTLDGSGWVQDEPWMRYDSISASADGGPTSTTLPHAPIAGSVRVTQITGSSIDDYGQADLSPSVAGNVVSYSPVSSGVITIQYQWASGTPKARVRKYLGGPSQDLSSILQPMFPALLTSADKFAGDACLIVELTFDQNAFPTGIPNVTAVMRGAKVYDPRTTLTVWSENPALIAYDWARYEYGGNCASAVISTADVIAAANACDVSTVFTTPAGSTTRPLYTCGIVCRTDQDPSQSLDEIIESMAGRSAWSGGMLRMRAGVYRAPVATITEDWLSGTEAITIVPEAPADEAINIVRATISDAAQGYVIAPQPDLRASAYITADGRELPFDLTFGGVTDSVHAQHIGGVILREARSGLTVTLPCNWRAFQLEVFDVISVTLARFGWSAKLFEVAEWRFSLTGGIYLVLRETAASIFTPDALFSDLDATPNTQLPSPFAVPVPTGLTLASGTTWLLRQDDGTVTTRLHVSWAALTDRPVLEGGGIDVRYGSAMDAESTWTTVPVPGGDNQVNLTGVLDGGMYIVKLRARNALVTGDWCQHVAHKIVGKSALPAAVAGLTATAIPGFVRLTWTAGIEVDEAGVDLGRGASWAAATGLEGQAAKSFAAGFKVNSYDWAWPAPGSYTVRAKRRDTSGLQSTEASIGLTVTTAGLSVDWSNISGTGKPKAFRVSSMGYLTTTSPAGSGAAYVGLFDAETMYQYSGAITGYHICKINRATGVVTYVTAEQPLNSGTGANLATVLNAIGGDHIVVIYTYDEPATNRLVGSPSLATAIYRCGGSRGVFESSKFNSRAAYVLIGIPGAGEGNGFEVMQPYDGSNSWIDTTFSLVNGNPIFSNGGTVVEVGTPWLANNAATAPNYLSLAASTFEFSGGGEVTKMTLPVNSGGLPVYVNYSLEVNAQANIGLPGQVTAKVRIYVNGTLKDSRMLVTDAGGNSITEQFVGIAYEASPPAGSYNVTVSIEVTGPALGAGSLIAKTTANPGCTVYALGTKR